MPDVDDQFISFIYAVRDSLSLPAIITDKEENIITWRDLDSTKTNIHPSALDSNSTLQYDPDYFQKQLNKMKKAHPPIHISLDTGEEWRVYYRDSRPYRSCASFLICSYRLLPSF